MNILIVEDNAESARRLKASIMEAIEINIVKNGVEALVELHRQHYDLIISDTNMPKMDGYLLAKTVKSNINTKTIPFWLYSSATASQENIELAIRMGADRYIEEPRDIKDEVMKQIRNSFK